MPGTESTSSPSPPQPGEAPPAAAAVPAAPLAALRERVRERVAARVPARVKRAWPHVVAAFLVFHVAAHLTEAIPDVRVGLDKRAWKEPGAQHEIDQWARRLGIEGKENRQKFEEVLFELGLWMRDTRTLLRTPWEPYMTVTAQRQSWAMFVAGSRYQERFQVRSRTCPTQMDRECEWRVLYERGNDDYRFMADVLENARIRSANFRWAWPNNKKQYERGCRAIAWQVFDAFPNDAVVECRFLRTVAPRPGTDVSDFKPEWSRSRIVRREELSR